ncbi:MAG: ATP-binding protein [bacterium]
METLGKIVFPGEAMSLAGVRERVRRFLKSSEFHEEERARLVMAVDEACSNAIRHASDGLIKPVRLEMKLLHDRVRFVLRDYGKPFKPTSVEARNLKNIRPVGYGLFIINEVFDVVEYTPQPRGTRLKLEKLLPAERPQSCF